MEEPVETAQDWVHRVVQEMTKRQDSVLLQRLMKMELLRMSHERQEDPGQTILWGDEEKKEEEKAVKKRTATIRSKETTPKRRKADERSWNTNHLALIRKLREMDHDILVPAVVQEYAEAFGCELKSVRYGPASGAIPKNASDTECRGLGSDEIAERLCLYFGVKYKSCHGRGSALRECCGRLLEHFSPLVVSLEKSTPV